MVLFHSYASLPEGTSYVSGFNMVQRPQQLLLKPPFAAPTLDPRTSACCSHSHRNLPQFFQQNRGCFSRHLTQQVWSMFASYYHIYYHILSHIIIYHHILSYIIHIGHIFVNFGPDQHGGQSGWRSPTSSD